MVGCLLLLSHAAHIYHIPTFPLQWPPSLLFVAGLQQSPVQGT